MQTNKQTYTAHNRSSWELHPDKKPVEERQSNNTVTSKTGHLWTTTGQLQQRMDLVDSLNQEKTLVESTNANWDPVDSKTACSSYEQSQSEEDPLDKCARIKTFVSSKTVHQDPVGIKTLL